MTKYKIQYSRELDEYRIMERVNEAREWEPAYPRVTYRNLRDARNALGSYIRNEILSCDKYWEDIDD